MFENAVASDRLVEVLICYVCVHSRGDPILPFPWREIEPPFTLCREMARAKTENCDDLW